jgi:Uma2 family endonuclease
MHMAHHPRSVIVVDDSEVEPDLMVLPPVKAPFPEWEDAPRPLLVVEVLSESTNRRDRIAKRGLYLEARIAEYWMADGDKRSITVVRPDQPDAVVADRLVWSPQGAPEPLELDVTAVFREALD